MQGGTDLAWTVSLIHTRDFAGSKRRWGACSSPQRGEMTIWRRRLLWITCDISKKMKQSLWQQHDFQLTLFHQVEHNKWFQLQNWKLTQNGQMTLRKHSYRFSFSDLITNARLTLETNTLVQLFCIWINDIITKVVVAFFRDGLFCYISSSHFCISW